MPRKHLISESINQKQQWQAKIWQKLAREIKAAAKIGGTNIDTNPRLKNAVEKALKNNLSKESIERNINGKHDGGEMYSLEFECYGPNGIQIIIGVLTDNTNRVISSLNGFLAKLDGKIAKPNSVKSFFDNLGYIILLKNNIILDDLIEITMPYEIIDIIENEDSFEIIVSPKDFYNLKNLLIKNNIEIYDSEIKLIPQNYVTNISKEIKQKLDKFIDSCMNDEDIQWIVTNYSDKI